MDAVDIAQEIDLSALVPAGAKGVILELHLLYVDPTPMTAPVNATISDSSDSGVLHAYLNTDSSSGESANNSGVVPLYNPTTRTIRLDVIKNGMTTGVEIYLSGYVT
jgi:hypothetical protein